MSNQQVLGRRNQPKVRFYDKDLDKCFASAPKKSLGIYKCHTGTKNRQNIFAKALSQVGHFSRKRPF